MVQNDVVIFSLLGIEEMVPLSVLMSKQLRKCLQG